MKNPAIGSREKLDKGKGPDIAINRQGAVIEAHQAEAGFNLWYRQGTWNNGTIDWGHAHHYDEGDFPVRLAANDQGVAVEMHRSNSVLNNYYMYHVGHLEENKVFRGKGKDSKLSDVRSVTMNNDNIVVVTRRYSGKHYHIGKIDVEKGSIDWGKGIKFGSTSEASSVSLNNKGQVAVAYGSTIRFGQLNSRQDEIHWLMRLDLDDYDVAGSIALNDDAYAVVPISKNGTNYLIAVRFYYQSRLKKWLADRSSKAVYERKGGGLFGGDEGIKLGIAEQDLVLVEYKSDHQNDGTIYCATGALI